MERAVPITSSIAASSEEARMSWRLLWAIFLTCVFCELAHFFSVWDFQTLLPQTPSSSIL